MLHNKDSQYWCKEKEVKANRLCDYEGCADHATYPAPRSPGELRSYYWFCLKHVQAYNKAWNFYNNFSTQDMEAVFKNTATWERPTWRFGTWSVDYSRFFSFSLDELLYQPQMRHEKKSFLNDEERQALKCMDLAFPFTLKELKARYRTLVKSHHPDLNKGCKVSEEKLKEVNHAFTILSERLKKK